ncbi:LysR substrate-binding domain-containing protein [Pseudomonas sp. KNUC1026]|nr:LysR substrate-binding domain-containing protein [Pseudomonas sp. KNUC1026]UFH51218.1 LysR substrate-binding domain-containing protein [Pseudomonas sp. KNUC1026]
MHGPAAGLAAGGGAPARQPTSALCRAGLPARPPGTAAPEDLARHNCIVLRQFGSDYALWRFERGGQVYTHKVSGTLASNDGEVAMSLALDGHGLLLRSRWDVHEHLQSGRLQAVMAEYTPPPAHIHAVYPHSRHVPRRISLFVAHLKASLGERLPYAALT